MQANSNNMYATDVCMIGHWYIIKHALKFSDWIYVFHKHRQDKFASKCAAIPQEQNLPDQGAWQHTLLLYYKVSFVVVTTILTVIKNENIIIQ